MAIKATQRQHNSPEGYTMMMIIIIIIASHLH